MSFQYKNPISPNQLTGQQSVDRSKTYGTNFSTLSTGGYMEVFSLNELYYTSTGTTIISEFGTTMRADSIENITFMSGWTANTISGVSGETNSTAVWKIYSTPVSFTGNTSATCINDLYVENLYGCSPINVNDLLIGNSGITTTSLTAITISATTYLNLPLSPGGSFTGGTVSGTTNFTNGLTATTISATTYQNLPINYGSFGLTIDGGGSDIIVGNKGYAIIPYAGTITGWNVIGNTSGSCVIDVWKTTSGNIPTSGDTITGTEKPTLSSQQINSDLNLTTWTTSVSQYDVIGFNVDSTSGLTRVNLSIYIIKQ